MIRLATIADAAAFTSIYNQNFDASAFANCDRARAVPENQAEKLRTADPRYPTFVCEAADGRVAGYGALKHFRTRPLWRDHAEVAVYVDTAARNRLVGARLQCALLRAADEHGFRRLVAIVIHLNTASLRGLHASGFETSAVLRKAAFLHGRWIDSVWLTRDAPFATGEKVQAFGVRAARRGPDPETSWRT
jgi:L-amino acid N-acyltransferase YncA